MIGFEPTTFSLEGNKPTAAKHCDSRHSLDTPDAVVAPVVAVGADNGPMDPDLARLVDAWRTLPENIRTAILALVGAARAPEGSDDG